ncbi:uncharacterized protein LOC110715221 [Chenopodium quinoa]|uniref:uncharacterized protein LOC110715221 n=1 Tax=Chenopodium quinoa TaxID=63459 RepID=UPI000B78C59F|nr:uncharacterized protein LOC110715221 [Chenopodium quinoa]
MRFSSSSKPISSPGRTEKFPPPLMRFLRSNVGSRSSRRRTRKPPLFMRRKKALTSSSAIEITQEPSSPKVTCMGQVRVIRSKSKNRSSTSQYPNKKPSKNNNNKKNNKDTNQSCYCFRKPGFCKWNLCKPKFPKWVSFFNCRSVKVRTDSSKFGSKRFEQEEGNAAVELDERRERQKSISIEEITTTTMTETTIPPKNALLLTRCRSAPYRTSSLACRFWGSPLRGESEDTETEIENRVSGIEVSRDSTSSQSRGDRDNNTERRPSLKREVEICAIVQHQGVTTPHTNNESVIDIFNKTLPKYEKHDGVEAVAKALMLMRCKSEPARRDSENLIH